MFKIVDGKKIEMTAEEVATHMADCSSLFAVSLSDFTSAITAWLNLSAKERRYDDALSIATYVNSTNVQWAAEAQAFVAWRDRIWTYCYSEFDKVQAGQRQQPTIDAFLTEIQAAFPLSWPAAD